MPHTRARSAADGRDEVRDSSDAPRDFLLCGAIRGAEHGTTSRELARSIWRRRFARNVIVASEDGVIFERSTTVSKTLKIAVIGGDGTGPEVTAEALKVLEAVAKLEGFHYELTDFDFGGERYLKTGRFCRTVRSRNCAATTRSILGAVGHPDVAPGILEKGLLLELAVPTGPVHQPAPGQALSGRRDAVGRQRARTISILSSFARTPKTCTAGVGGFLKKHTPDEVATQTAVYTRKGL